MLDVSDSPATRLVRETELDSGLEVAMQRLLAGLQASGYSVTYECEDWPAVLPSAYTRHLYAIVCEALTNIRKHAQASTIHVFIFSYEDRLYLSIGDDGIGISTPPSPGYHQGIIGLHERVALLDGQVSIEGSPSEGTRIDIDVPLP